MTRIQSEGSIGDVDVSITVEGPELPAEQIHMSLHNHADELRQILVEDIPPKATELMVAVDWEIVLEELEERDVDLEEGEA